ncbi:MAG TPA: hypothetical protein VMF65_22955 [Acidimicrobiales bacterium]|nr:hypothetical protein [Acidimicrobiales bacterium]
MLGDARSASGGIRFAPAAITPGRRRIVAVVSLPGQPQQTIVAGSYTAPAILAPRQANSV